MQLVMFHLDASGALRRAECTSLLEVRSYALGLDGPLALDAAAPDGPCVDSSHVEPWLRNALTADVLVTARAFYHLSELEHGRVGKTVRIGTQVPMYCIVGGLDHPTLSGGAGGIRDSDVVRRLIEMPIERVEETLPRPFVLRIWEGRFDDLESLLRCPDRTLADHHGLGQPALELLNSWVRRTTSALGFEVAREHVRDLLLMGLPEPTQDTGATYAPARAVQPVRAPYAPNQTGARPAPATVTQEEGISAIARSLPPSLQALPTASLPGAPTRVHNVLPRQGIRTVGDLVGIGDDDMLSWRNFGHTSLKSLRKVLLKLQKQAKAAGISSESSTPPASSSAAMRAVYLQQPLLEQIQSDLARLGARMRRIADARLLSEDPLTLEELSHELGVSRERVRQIAVKTRNAIGAQGWYCRLADQRIAGLRRGRSSPLTLETLESFDEWFSGITDSPALFARCLDVLGATHAAVQIPDGPWIVTARACADLDHVAKVFRSDVAGSRRNADVDAMARSHLQALGAGELLPVFLVLLGERVDGPKGVVFDPTLVQRVEAILAAAEGPLHVREIEKRLRQAGIEFGPSAVRGCLDRADTINTGRSTYILAAKLKPWLSHLGQVQTEVRSLLESDASKQWSSEDILSVLQDDNLEWAHSMPVHVIDFLLREIPTEFRRLGRGQWCLASAKVRRRMPIIEVCEAVLEEAGRPLPYNELIRRARERRSMGQVLNVKWPLVRIGDGEVALGPRDLGIDAACFLRVDQRIREELSSGRGRVSRDEIAQIFEIECGQVPEVEPSILAGALRTSSRVALDGERSDGLRMAENERLGAPSGASARSGVRGAAVNESATRDGGASEVTIDELLGDLDAGYTLEEIADLVLADAGGPVPAAALRLRLRTAGWVQGSDGRWYQGAS